MTTVTAVLVSHDGARWLPRALRHLDDLTTRPDRLVAVDTGSTDGSAELLRDHVVVDSLLEVGTVGFGAALEAALSALPPALPGPEWVWILHDDSAPHADALTHLLAATAPPADPAARAPAVLGPKTREWPSLRRLLEVGATVTGTGRREVGLERGEYDQGQHDLPRDVLAVGTAGMLVRRDVLEELGFDDDLPVTWSDIDFGWRANRAGHGVRTVPTAVVFHADATRTGRRDPTLGRAARRRADRVGAARTLLMNTPGPHALVTSVRLVLGALLRFVGLLLVRAPAEAWGELSALPHVFLRPDRMLRSRRARRATAQVPPGEVRGLLAPWWTPYRHGLDELTDIGQALTHELRGDDAERRTPFGALRRPAPALFLILLLGSLWVGRQHLADGPGSLPALLPPPDSAWAWWETYLSTTHQTGLGSTATAAPYLLPMALLATLATGSAVLATQLVLVLALPVAGVGCHRLLSRSVGPVLAVAASLGYALVVAMTGAVAQGRLGTLVVAAVLPWAVSAAAGLAASDAYTRRRAVWRTSLWLWLAASFVPAVLVVAAVGLTGAAAVRARSGRPYAAALVPAPTALVLLLPWSALAWTDSGWRSWLVEAGTPYSAGVATADPWSLLLARPAELGGAPAWLSAGLVVLAVLALLRRRTRREVGLAWLGAVVALAWAVAVLLAASEPTWVGTPLVAAHGALLVATALAGAGLREELAGSAFGARQLAGTLGAAVGAATLAAGTLWWLQSSPTPDPALDLPRYMTAAAEADPAVGTLVLRGSHDAQVAFEVRRSGGPHLGDEALVADPAAEESLTALLTRLLAAPDREAASDLSGHGVEFVLLPPPVDQVLGAVLDATPGLTSASAGESTARAWRVEAAPELPRTTSDATRARLRPLLLTLQLAGLVVVAVLAAPGRRGRR